MNRLLNRPSAFAQEAFEAGPDNIQMLQEDAKVLVIGAGGLGCELLKDLALSGIVNIHVIDLDTIDLSNLNRQFLFRMKDVGRKKCEVAAEFVKRRCPGVNITTSTEPCQNFDAEFFKQFQVVIGGVDNIDARRWLNQMIHNIVEFDGADSPEVGTFYVDGGTEGFQGQARVVNPFTTSCYECTLDQLPPDTNSYPMCTVKETPRLPEHCI